jgi:anti-anti-sigma factor
MSTGEANGGPELRPALLAALRAAAEGDLSVRLPIGGSPEEREIAAALNRVLESGELARFSADLSLRLDAAGPGVQSRLDRLAELLVPRLADVCAIDLESDGRLARVCLRGPDDRPLAERADRRRAAEDVLRTGEPRLLDDPPGLVVPIWAHGRGLGTITLLSLDGGRGVDEDDLRMASDIGRRAGLAVENARLFEEQATVALTLQKSLLPRHLPEVPGVGWAGRYMSKASGTEAGGDWFAAVPAGGSCVTVAVGDVVGRGTAAAAVMGQLRSATRAYATAGMRPAALLGHLSRLAEGVSGAFASTAACVQIDHVTGRLRYARAGHPPPLLIDAGGRARFLRAPAGTVLGMRHDDHEELILDMPDGAALLLYTDGAVERRDELIDVGLARLALAAEAAWPAAPSELCEAIAARLFPHEAPDDDVALLVVRRGLPPTLSLRAPAHPGELTRVRHRLRDWLRTVPMAEGDREDVILACGEAISNSVEHGAGRVDGTMWLTAAWDWEGVLRLTVRDDGVWREPAADPEGLRGRGLAIARHVMDDVSIDTGPHHTEVRMTLRAAAPPNVVVNTSGTAPSRPPGRAMRFVLDRRADRVLVRLEGEIDAAAVPALRAELEPLAHTESLVIDATGVGYIDSAAVALLHGLGRILEVRGEDLAVVAPPGSPVRRLLEMSAEGAAELLDASPGP